MRYKEFKQMVEKVYPDRTWKYLSLPSGYSAESGGLEHDYLCITEIAGTWRLTRRSVVVGSSLEEAQIQLQEMTFDYVVH